MTIPSAPIGMPAPAAPVASFPGRDSERSAAPQAAALPKGKLSGEQLNAAVEELNKAMQVVGTSLSFSVDKATKRTVVRVLDARSGEVIRQIPAEEMMRVSQRIAELMGILFDEAA